MLSGLSRPEDEFGVTGMVVLTERAAVSIKKTGSADGIVMWSLGQ